MVEAADGSHDVAEIARIAGDACEVQLDPADVAAVLEKKVFPLGVLAGPDGKSPELKKADPFLALRARAKVVPDGVVRVSAAVFRPLYFPLIAVAVLGALGVFDFWLFTRHGVAQSVRQVLYRPEFIIVALGAIVISAAMHEFGHASALMRAGGKPGGMGVGLYIVWPVFYTDVTDSYRLGRGGRLLTDFGGVYFNVVFSLAMAGLYFLTGWEALLIIIVLQHLEMLHQFLPFVRLDGYYMVSDLTGVPDLFGRIRPILASLLPWRKTDEKVTELKRWTRVVVTLWVLIIVPVLIYVFSMMIMHMPRILGTGWDAMNKQIDAARKAMGDGNVLGGIASYATIAAIALPMIAMPYTVFNVVKRLGRGAWRATNGRPIARALTAFAVVGVLGFAAFILWPDGDYRPIGPHERGTFQESIVSFKRVSSGRPGLVPADPAATVEPSAGPTTEPTTAPSPTSSSEPTSAASQEPSASPTPTETGTASPTPTPS